MTPFPAIRVLLVEDDEDDVVITRALLDEAEAASFTVDWVAGWEAGREAILTGQHDVYLLDYRLGGQSGLELLCDVKARGAQGPFILLTGQGSREIDLEAMAAGAASYLSKRTLDPPILERTIRYAIELRRAEGARRDAEERARQGERLADLGAVTARIVHDLGNPLAAMVMQIDLLRRKVATNPDQPLGNASPTLEQLTVDLHRLGGLVREFLDFSREQRLTLAPLSIPHFFDDIVRAWQPIAAARGVTLRSEVCAGMPPVVVDPDKMRRVFDNLVKNAIEAVGDGEGTVAVAASIEGDTVCIHVDDDGCGVPPGVDPFRLFHTSKPEGTGLGLPIVREIVQAHGGSVALESPPAGGTRVRVVLPLRG